VDSVRCEGIDFRCAQIRNRGRAAFQVLASQSAAAGLRSQFFNGPGYRVTGTVSALCITGVTNRPRVPLRTRCGLLQTGECSPLDMAFRAGTSRSPSAGISRTERQRMAIPRLGETEAGGHEESAATSRVSVTAPPAPSRCAAARRSCGASR